MGYADFAVSVAGLSEASLAWSGFSSLETSPKDPCDAWFFIGHRRYVKDGHRIRDAGFLIGKP